MIDLTAYVLEPLWQDGACLLYRGQPRDRSAGIVPAVLVVAPVGDHPAPASLRRLEHEYALRAELDPAWAVRPLALAQHQGRPVLVLEDPGGEPLARLLGRPLAVPQGVRLAIGLAAALGQLHGRGLIHKDLKPAHVFVNGVTGQVWLTGFGIASRRPRQRQAPAPPEFIAGTLAYMAPEQTGRMNRSVDARSDLYALGVTLYEMLTGSLPFTASEPMEWVHYHIARQPAPPAARRKEVAGAISAIIMKLLAKTAEDRYQTAAGVESDLRRCLAAWEAGRRIDDFPLGAHDTPDRLVIPEKLYGRQREIETLLAAFDRVIKSGTPELVLVSGYSGIGKSSVVNELHKVLVPPRGLFASGKFDQYKRDIPYASLAQAFQSLVRSLLGKSEEELDRWRDALRDALGPNGQLMVDLVPELRLIIGEQAPVPELPPQDAQRRFQLVFRRFLGVFARPEHPLALFLDDLQWLDAATLDLLEHLLTQTDVRHALLIGAYRDNEVTSAHPLMRKLEAIRNAGTLVQEIVLAPLAREDVGQLIADALYCDRERAAPLAQLVYEKTAGNPFFAMQFLSALVEEGLVTFDHAEARWLWDLTRIHAKGYTDNVADLMVGKLSRLPVDTQKGLRQLACLGNSAEFSLLAMVYEDSTEELYSDLQDAVRTGLVLLSDGAYTFLHDRVREAAYSLIPEAERAETHLRIGRLLAAHTPPEKREEAIFEIVNQLNRGAALITARDEREQLAELNLIAGRRAQSSTAYVLALTYLVDGRALLSDESWDHHYELVFGLEFHLAECEFLTGNMTAADDRLSRLAQRARLAEHIVAVVRLRITLYTALDRSDRAVEVCLEYLERTGTHWSPRPTSQEVQREYDRIRSQLGNRSIEALVDLPPMTDPDALASLDVLTEVVPPALFTDENLASLVICRMVNLALEHGNSDGSCFAYVTLGMIAGPRFHNYEVGFRFGQLGYDLVEQRGWHRFQARIYMVFSCLVMPWTRHIRAARDFQRHAFDAANSIGDLTFAAFSCAHLSANLLAAGDPLVEAQREAEQRLEFAQNARIGLVIHVITAQLGLIRTLRGLSPKFGSFDGTLFDELRFERQLSGDPALAQPECLYWIRKLQARFFAQDYPSAIHASARAQRLLWTVPSGFDGAEYHFYSALSHAASCDSTAGEQRQQHVEALVEHHRQLEIWAAHCLENFANRAALASAEIARIEGRELDAEHLYEKAIRSARENGFVHNEALAYELAARFYAARGFETISHAYLRNARYGYLRWGAEGKVRQLDQLYPHLSTEEAAAAPTGTIGVPVEHLDLATVLKVSQAVSGEIVLEKLLDTLMRTAIEHAGAERGLLLLPRGDELRVAAEATTRGDTVIVHLAEQSMAASALPEAIVNYVIRTRDSVLLDDAAAPHAFAADAYLGAQHARSILCVPLLNQAKLTGVLYLENTLTPHVFTPTRRAVLTLLASQAAISLENARLYAERQRAEETVRQSEKQLRDVIETVPAIVWTALPDGSNVFANRGWAEYTGRSAEDTAGAGWQTAAHPEDVERYVEEWHASLATGEPFEGEVRLRAADGEYRWFLARGRPLRDEQGQILRWYGVLTDIEDRKRAEEEVRASEEALRNAQAELARVTRVLTVGELTASIAHEVNQPLTGVITNGQACLRWLARDEPNLEEARAAVHRIIRDGNRASQVVTRIRALLQKGATQKGWLNLNHVLDDILALAQGELRRAGVSVQTAFAEHLPAVWADRVQLQQVVLNLIVNAIEAMTSVMDRPRRLHLRTAVEGHRILVTVRDTGVGMQPDVLDHLFETFYTTKPQGIGMGLAISQSIIHAHGGQLWAIPNDDHGATFLFTLPTGEEGRA
jgi:PAS domain S-box-containing protein